MDLELVLQVKSHSSQDIFIIGEVPRFVNTLAAIGPAFDFVVRLMVSYCAGAI